MDTRTAIAASVLVVCQLALIFFYAQHHATHQRHFDVSDLRRITPSSNSRQAGEPPPRRASLREALSHAIQTGTLHRPGGSPAASQAGTLQRPGSLLVAAGAQPAGVAGQDASRPRQRLITLEARRGSPSPSNGSANSSQTGPPERGVLVAILTSHYFTDYEGVTPCTFEGRDLGCKYLPAHPGDATYKEADVLWYHIPHHSGPPHAKARPQQLTVGMSMESAAYYSSLDDPKYMGQFDLEMTYRRCSQVPVFYFDFKPGQEGALFQQPVPWENKTVAVAYVNSNCDAVSGRSAIMRNLMKLNSSDVPVHSYGRCDRNMKVTGSFDKVQLFRSHLFCVAMENSVAKDYVSEKLWNALEAGCVPIYLGPSNIRDFLPHPDAIVNYADFGSPEALNRELARLANDRAAYEAKLAWKKRGLLEQSPGFVELVRRSRLFNPHTRCQLCALAVRHRRKPDTKYTTCLFNQTWLNGSGLAGDPSAGRAASKALALLPPPSQPRRLHMSS